MTTCTHPPTRLYAWYVDEPQPDGTTVSTLCVCCCACGAVLKGGA